VSHELLAVREIISHSALSSGSSFFDGLLHTYGPRLSPLFAHKVQSELRKAELENLRLAARLLNAEREDPDIEKKIVVTGNGAQLSINVDNP
jgi:hypothetical protein